MLREADAGRDAEAIAAIYNYYIRETTITFEDEPVSAEEMRGRILAYTAEGYPWLVAEEAGRIVGYAYAHRYRERAAYRHTCEVTVYCDPGRTGRGYGPRLMERLLDSLRQLDHCYTAVALIAGGNQRSVELFRRLGFEAGERIKNAGRKHGQWLDTYAYVYALKDYQTIEDG